MSEWDLPRVLAINESERICDKVFLDLEWAQNVTSNWCLWRRRQSHRSGGQVRTEREESDAATAEEVLEPQVGETLGG